MTLLARLQSAERGDRGLDAEVWLRFNRPDYTGPVIALEMRGWYDGRGHLILETAAGEEVADDLGIGNVTTSLDAALALAERVLPGCWPGLQSNRWVEPSERWSAWINQFETDSFVECDANTPALALCTAVLSAMEKNP